MLRSRITHTLDSGKSCRLRESNSGRVVLKRLEVGQGVWQRSVGLIGRASLAPDSGLWLEPCNGVHTWFMRYAIDVVYLDRTGIVLHVAANVRPWRLCLPMKGCRSILELPSGAAERIGILVGSRYEIDEIPAR